MGVTEEVDDPEVYMAKHEQDQALQQHALSTEELEQEAATELPDREAMSLINASPDPIVSPDPPVFALPYEPPSEI